MKAMNLLKKIFSTIMMMFSIGFLLYAGVFAPSFGRDLHYIVGGLSHECSEHFEVFGETHLDDDGFIHGGYRCTKCGKEFEVVTKMDE